MSFPVVYYIPESNQIVRPVKGCHEIYQPNEDGVFGEQDDLPPGAVQMVPVTQVEEALDVLPDVASPEAYQFAADVLNLYRGRTPVPLLPVIDFLRKQVKLAEVTERIALQLNDVDQQVSLDHWREWAENFVSEVLEVAES